MIIKLTLTTKEIADAMIDAAELYSQVQAYKLKPTVITNKDGTAILILSNEGKEKADATA